MVEREGDWPIPWQPVEGDRGGLLAWIEYAALRAALAVGSRLPAFGRRALVAVLARVARVVDRRHTRSARAFLAQALGARTSAAERERMVLGAWRHLIEMTLEDARLNRVLGPRLLEHCQVEMHDDVRKVLASSQGGFVIVPHVGNWEALTALLPAFGFRPLYAVTRPPRNRPLSRHLQRMREMRGMRMLHRHGAVDGIRQVIGAGCWVGLLLDQRARGKTVLAPFFGRLAHCERSIGVLVRRTRAPIVLGACYRGAEPLHFRAVFTRVLWPDELAQLSPEEFATTLNREFEQLILAHPEQYFWLHDRYYNAPVAEVAT